MKYPIIYKSFRLFNYLSKQTKILILIGALIFTSCGNKSTSDQKEEEHGHEEAHENETTVSLSSLRLHSKQMEF